MKVYKLYSDAAGESHWEDLEVHLEERVFAPPAEKIEISDALPATQTLFLKLRSGWNEPAHPTPSRQQLVCLSGSITVTASDQETRHIGPGDVWHMEDTHGKGHHTIVTSEEDFDCVIVQFK